MAFELYGIENVTSNITTQILENQEICKCLKYDSTDALTKADLTKEEKKQLIEQDNTENTRIFDTPFFNETSLTCKSQLRYFISSGSPDNSELMNIRITFEIIVSNDLWKLDYGDKRALIILKNLTKQLNDMDINVIGNLVFDPFKITCYTNNYTGYTQTVHTRVG